MVTVLVHFLITVTEYPRQASLIKKRGLLHSEFCFYITEIERGLALAREELSCTSPPLSPQLWS